MREVDPTPDAALRHPLEDIHASFESAARNASKSHTPITVPGLGDAAFSWTSVDGDGAVEVLTGTTGISLYLSEPGGGPDSQYGKTGLELPNPAVVPTLTSLARDAIARVG